MFASDEYKDDHDLLEELVSEVRHLGWTIVICSGVLAGLLFTIISNR